MVYTNPPFTSWSSRQRPAGHRGNCVPVSMTCCCTWEVTDMKTSSLFYRPTENYIMYHFMWAYRSLSSMGLPPLISLTAVPYTFICWSWVHNHVHNIINFYCINYSISFPRVASRWGSRDHGVTSSAPHKPPGRSIFSHASMSLIPGRSVYPAAIDTDWHFHQHTAERMWTITGMCCWQREGGKYG